MNVTIVGSLRPLVKHFLRLRLHEAIFKGFDGERVIGPAKIFLKPYWRERGGSSFEGQTG